MLKRLAVVVAISLGNWSPALADVTWLVSRGVPGDTPVTGAEPRSLSADGRYVVLESSSSGWLAGVSDANETQDVFVWDRTTSTVALVSHQLDSPTTAANGFSRAGAISADGRFVSFLSYASNLIAGGTGCLTCGQTYLWDRDNGAVTLVSHRSSSATSGGNGASYPVAISSDGGLVAFDSYASNLAGVDANGTYDVFVWTRSTGIVTLVSHAAGAPTATADGWSSSPSSVSADGRYLAFGSSASNLIAGASYPGGLGHAFLWDRDTDSTTLVSHVGNSPLTAGNDGSGQAAISADGKYVAFVSGATDLIVEGSDSNGTADTYLWSRETGVTTLVSHAWNSETTAADGLTNSAALSSDGRYLLLQSYSTDLIAAAGDSAGDGETYLWDRESNTAVLVSHAAGSAAASNGSSLPHALSANGRYATFHSNATDLLVGGDSPPFWSDVYFWDRDTGVTKLVSHQAAVPTMSANESSSAEALSADGRYLLFRSYAHDLIAGGTDSNAALDAFVWDRDTNVVALASPASAQDLVPGHKASFARALSADGRYVAFDSHAANLVAIQTGHRPDTYLWEREAEAVTLVSHAFGSATTGGNSGSYFGALSGDGRYVAFQSTATDLLPAGSDTNGQTSDAFLWDRESGEVRLVSHALGAATTADNSSLPLAISADGRYLALLSHAQDLIAGTFPCAACGQAYLWDRNTDSFTLVSHTPGSATNAGNSYSEPRGISADGRYVLLLSYATDLVTGFSGCSGCPQSYLWDRESGALTVVSHTPASATAAANGPSEPRTISADGRYVSFQSEATDLIVMGADTNDSPDVFLWERDTNLVTLVSHMAGPATTTGNGASYPDTLSADGRYLAFQSQSSDLIAGGNDTNGVADAFLYDRESGIVTLVSHPPESATTAATGGYSAPRGISADGSHMTFYSEAFDLILGVYQTPARNAYRWERATGTVTLISHSWKSPTVSANSDAEPRAINADGRYVAFDSHATDLLRGDLSQQQAFLWFDGKGTFYTLAGCRLSDTRQAGTPLQAGVAAVIQVTGHCAVPATAAAVALNITILDPTVDGQLKMYRNDTATPESSVISFAAGRARANNAVVGLPANAAGTLAVLPVMADRGTVHLLIDVTGYFD